MMRMKQMKTLRILYKENAEKYAEAYKTIFEEGVVQGSEYRKVARKERAAAKRCHEIFEALRHQQFLGEIEEFMLHESPYVRYLASAHCLFSNPELAEKTLEELIETKGHKIQMHALTTLKAWRKIPWTEDHYK